MSLFGGLMGDFDEDPFFGSQMRRMNNMMNSMMGDLFSGPFGGGMFGPPALLAPPGRGVGGAGALIPHPGAAGGLLGPMAPFPGFPNLRDVFGGMNSENCHSYSSSTVMTMTSGPDGRPQVYQASTSMRQAPGGIKEMKKTVADSRTGVKKMSIGHHIGERAHVIEREQNVYHGTQEEHQEFINLDEEEAETFNEEWERKTHVSGGPAAIGYGRQSHRNHQRPRAHQPQLALPPPPSSSLRGGSEELEGAVGRKRKLGEEEDEEEEGGGVTVVEVDEEEDETEVATKRMRGSGSPPQNPIILDLTDSGEEEEEEEEEEGGGGHQD